MRTRTHTTGAGTRGAMTHSTTYYIHNYGDIIATKFGSNGEIEYLKKIAKSNTVTEPIGIKPYIKDYCLQMIGDDLYLFFNDNATAKDNKHSRKDFRRDRTDGTFAVKLNNAGVLQKDLIATKKILGSFTFDPHRDMLQLSGNKLAFVMARGRGFGRKTRMGTITIN
jgi:hypothetical protein